ncbi:unnamed protein product [Arctia plantaginis]|uniref:Uncharacterized protein n=1 Tax=Arctia plantaginis TaxID=874455 RepID=A0A8S1AML9_ARCPL|nr:unnamed protein product [Arctia plantaginis]
MMLSKLQLLERLESNGHEDGEPLRRETGLDMDELLAHLQSPTTGRRKGCDQLSRVRWGCSEGDSGYMSGRIPQKKKKIKGFPDDQTLAHGLSVEISSPTEKELR